MRWIIVALFILGAAALHYIGGLVSFGIGLWFLLAVGIGFVLGRWWALLLAIVPWLLGVGGGLITGRYAYLGESWQFIFLLSTGTGLIGISLGLASHAITARWTTRLPGVRGWLMKPRLAQLFGFPGRTPFPSEFMTSSGPSDRPACESSHQIPPFVACGNSGPGRRPTSGSC